MPHRFFLLYIGLLSVLCLLAYPIIQLGSTFHLVIAGVLIMGVGVPHGAVDHLIFQADTYQKKMLFFSLYLAAMGVGLLVWMFFPSVAFLLFLLLSAFHFGQSQFAGYGFKRFIRNTLYIIWGNSLLAGLILYRSSELALLSLEFADLGQIYRSLDLEIVKGLLWTSSSLTLLVFVLLFLQRQWTLKVFLKEVIIFIMLHCVFYLLPFIVGFTMYFTLFHSLGVLGQEFEFLKKKLKLKAVKHFILLLAPFTLLSFLGLFLGVLAVHNEWIQVSYFFLLLVFISVLTIPHSVVMDLFYKKIKR